MEEKAVQRYCSDIIKDGDELVIYTFKDEDDTDCARMVFDDPTVAGRFKHNSSPLTAEQREIVDGLTSKTSFLEKMLKLEEGDNKTSKLPAKDRKTLEKVDEPEMFFGMTVDEYEEKFKKVKKKFKKKHAEFESRAKDALLEAAKLYLGDKHDTAYAKYRLELNQTSLGSIMYQIHTMEEVSHSLAARIKVGGARMMTQDVLVFTGLQRIILDAQKYQFEYLQAVEASLKELKTDLEVQNNGGESQGSGDDAIVFIRGGKQFIDQLSKIKNTMNNYNPSPSKNKNLNPDADITDIQYEETHSSDELDGDKTLMAKNPLSGYEGATKHKKKIRGEDDEDEDGEDFIDI